MVNIAFVLTHNKTDLKNVAQIESLKTLIEEYRENVAGGKTLFLYYKIKGLPVQHQLKLYQIVPFGVKPPANKDTLISHNVLYGKNDKDKTGTHPRFFNWGLKRSTDYGADVCLYLEDPAKFDVALFKFDLAKLTSPADKTEFIEENCGKLSTYKLLKKIGQLDERKNYNNSLVAYKTRIAAGGLTFG